MTTYFPFKSIFRHPTLRRYLLAPLLVIAFTLGWTSSSFALSSACTALNADWGAGVSIAPASGVNYGNPADIDYQNFAIGEAISWQVSSTGAGAPGASTAVNLYNDNYNIILLDKHNEVSNFNLSGNINVNNSVNHNFQIQYSVDNSSGAGNSLYIRVTCSAGSASVTLAPAAGALTAGTVSSAYSQTVSATGGTAPYTYAITNGTLPAGLTLNTSTGAISGTPTTAGSSSFTVTATDANSATGAASYTLAIALQVPVANAVSATVAANSSANPITLNITGGAANSVLVASAPSHGSATASGTSITYTPTAGYSGADSFTYTATNTSGTSTAATVTVTVTAPTFTLSPAAGALTAGTVASTYSQTVSATGGTAPYTYAITNGTLAAGLTLNTSTGVISGTPTSAGNSSFTVTATDANSVTGAASYTLAIALQVPVANAVSATVAANSSANPITLNLTGGAANSVLVASAPSHGSATASGTSITYTPTAGYSGADSFTYTATNTSGTSTAATVTVTITAPAAFTFSPAAGALPGATEGTPYSETVSASGGTAPYIYAVTSGSLPAGLTLNASTGVISGTPTTAGNTGFTITATDANSATGSVTLSLAVIARPAMPMIFSPASGTLAGATAGTAYSTTVTTSGGVAPITYSATGLPAGMAIDAATGVISGTPTIAGSYSVAITATDSATPASTETASYTLAVAAAPAVTLTFSPAGGALSDAMAGEAYSAGITASGATGNLIYSLESGILPDGIVLNVSTGQLTGPLSEDAKIGDYTFTIAVRNSTGTTGSATYTIKVVERTVTVTDKAVDIQTGSTPANVYLNRGATGGPFVSADIISIEPPNAGTFQIVQGDIAQVGPVAPIGFYLKFTPNPAFSGQVRVGFRLTSALGISNNGVVSYNIGIDRAAVTGEIETLVQGFIQTRQSLIASTIKVPGLLERRRMEAATDPVTTRMTPGADGVTLGFATSTARIEAARNAIDGVSGGESSPFNVWIDGTLMFHNREENGSKWGSFSMLSTGADYLLSDKALVGLSFHFDHMTDPTDEDAELTGNGWLAGPYASFEIGKGVFFDTSLVYGGSWNDIDTAYFDGSFDTRRWLFESSIKGQWALDDVTVLTPKLRAIYLNEAVEDYSVSNDTGDTLDLDGFTQEQLRISLGAEIEREFTLDNGWSLIPNLGVTAGYAGLNGRGAFGSISAGVELSTGLAWTIDARLLFNIEGDGETSTGIRAGFSSRF